MLKCFSSCRRRISSSLDCCNNAKNEEEEVDSNMDGSGTSTSSSSAFVEVDVLRCDLNAARHYPNNSIRTAKYTWLSSFPLALFYQFYKVSNVYFLIVMILTLIPGASPVNPFSSIVPFCIVLGAGMSKDLWEDGKRRQSDRRANNIKTLVLRGADFVAVPSRDVSVGDVMLYKLGEEVLADVVLLNTSLADGVTYIETANLDGETNAKTRRAKPQTIELLGTVEDIIENCIPDYNMRKHFIQHGTIIGWNKSTSKQEGEEKNTPDLSSQTPKLGESLRRESIKKGGIVTGPPSILLHRGSNDRHGGGSISFNPTRESVNFIGAEASTSGAFHQAGVRNTHPRSSTIEMSDRFDPEHHQVYHRRQLTLDERFVVGREVPVPSDILELSRRYEKRRMSRPARLSVMGSQDPNLLEMTSKYPTENEMSINRHNSSSGGGGGRKSDANNEEIEIRRASEIDDNANNNNNNNNNNDAIEVSSGKSSSGVVILGAPPCPELYSWIGQLRMRDGEVVPLGIEQLLPRGCVIRNTDWVIGVVVYTGKNTKMLLNLRPKPMKISVIARRINILNIFLFLVHQIVLFILCGMAVRWRNSQLTPPPGTLSGHSIWYIQWNLSRYSPGNFFGWRYITNFVLLSYLIPLSLYVSLEFNKAMQMILIACDRRMANFDEFKGELRYSRPKTSELNCQLAHVRYIFTDKTGTLTENLMTYVGGCTASEKHDEQERPGGLGEEFLKLITQQKLGGSMREGMISSSADMRRGRNSHRQRYKLDFDEVGVEKEPLFQYLRALALCHTVVCFDRPVVIEEEEAGQALVNNNNNNNNNNINTNTPPRPSVFEGSINSIRRMTSESRDPIITTHHERQISAGFGASISGFHASTTSGVGRYLHGRTGSVSWFAARHSDMQAHQRTATTSNLVNELKDETKIYEGQSLDEIALVTAARDNLFALQKRSTKHMFIKVLEKVMCYEIIAELEFTPQRKLMSILLCRNPTHDNVSADEQGPALSSYHRVASSSTHEPLSSSHLPPTPPPLKGIVNVLGDQRGVPIFTSGASDEEEEEEEEEEERIKGKNPHSNIGSSNKPNNEVQPYLLLVKGADSSMLKIINKDNPRNMELKPIFEKELDQMAKKGLRTLILGQKYLSETEVRAWMPTFNEAQCSVHNRDDKLHDAYALMEKDIDLIGTTAVEDQLQEGVPETLEFFLQAEIVVWMLTGDKRETAVTIAGTSGLIDPQFENCVCHLDLSDASAEFTLPSDAMADTNIREMLNQQILDAVHVCDEVERNNNNNGTRAVVIVVDGRTLDIIFSDESFTSDFFQLGIRCRSAVCCRMTPLQKAKVVQLFQKNTNDVALAIGDGANDVSMIQESHIGIGIMGLEGSQAELASDYAIPKFRFLKRLLMVHGRFSLYRDAHCIVFSLYKNVTLSAALIAYTCYSGFSGMLLVDSWLLAMFNLFFCSLQPLTLGIFDKDVEDELAESLPALYPALSREQMFFNWKYILKWLLDGVIDGLILFFITIYTVAQLDELYPYHSASLEDYGMLFYIMMLLVLNLRVAGLMTCYTAISTCVITFGFIAIPLLTLAYSAIPNLLGSNWCVWVALELMGTIKCWLCILLAAGVYIIYGVAMNTYISLFWPWTNGGAAMRAAWGSAFRVEHHDRLQRLL